MPTFIPNPPIGEFTCVASSARKTRWSEKRSATSAASPQLVGLIALTNQLADQNHTSHVGYLNLFLYQPPASDFTDIIPQTFNAVTLAHNSNFGSGISGMAVLPGYDLATGFGSPKAYQFVHDLAVLLP